MPRRLQRSRRRGYRQPAGAIYVGRPTRWGNPFVVGGGRTRVEAVTAYRAWLAGRDDVREAAGYELGGHDLVCWCPLEDVDGNRVPCHADVLLEVANSRCEG